MSSLARPAGLVGGGTGPLRAAPVLLVALRVLAVVLVVLCPQAPAPARAADGGQRDRAPQLEVEGDAAAGYVRVLWGSVVEGGRYELEQATRPDFQDAVLRYRGEHTASVLSGLDDGTLFFRARLVSGTMPGPWSEAKSFTVQHHSRALAVGFLFSGALVFVLTAGFLYFFSRRVSDD